MELVSICILAIAEGQELYAPGASADTCKEYLYGGPFSPLISSSIAILLHHEIVIYLVPLLELSLSLLRPPCRALNGGRSQSQSA